MCVDAWSSSRKRFGSGGRGDAVGTRGICDWGEHHGRIFRGAIGACMTNRAESYIRF